MTEHLHNQETVSAALKRATKAFSGLKVINVIKVIKVIKVINLIRFVLILNGLEGLISGPLRVTRLGLTGS